MARIQNALLLILCCYAAPTWALGPGDISEIQDLLTSERFAELHKRLREYEVSFNKDKNPTTEGNLNTIYQTFHLPDEAFEPVFDRWVAGFPDLHYPNLARALYYYSMAWAKRGRKYRKETADKQIKDFNYYLQKSYRDAATALRLQPEHLAAFVLLIDMAKTKVTSHSPKDIFLRGNLYHPLSRKLYMSYALAIIPRWGSTKQEREELLAAADERLDQAPHLGVVHAVFLDDQADRLRKKPELAKKTLARALEFTEIPHVYNSLYFIYQDEKNFRKAASVIRKATELRPDRASYSYLLGHSSERSHQWAECIKAATWTIKRRTSVVKSLRQRGYCHENLNQLDKAASDYRRALAIGGNQEWTIKALNRVSK